MHVFTSVTANYIPKARVLAQSVKHHHPEAHFTLVLSDHLPEWLKLDDEPFDLVVTGASLGIAEFPAWAFKHSVVEMCTAVKGTTFQYLIRELGAEKIFFLDPDIAVMGRLDVLLDRLDRSSILLTPHQTIPEETREAVIDNEICSLKHGVFNLGFLGIRASEEGRRFIDWWAERLLSFCYDDIPGGLFTDQRWIDLAPCFFEGIDIVREPSYNVATWNLTHRQVSGHLDNLMVNGVPLYFYHFSGFDSGDQEMMLNKYGSASPVLKDLRNWYIEECNRNGQEAYGRLPSKYQFFANGSQITKAHRVIYRWRKDLNAKYPDPYIVEEGKDSYFQWFHTHGAAALESWLLDHPSHAYTRELLESKIHRQRDELNRVYHSRTWRLARLISRFANPFSKV